MKRKLIKEPGPIFIEGYLSDRINAGDYPDYSFKYNRLPKVKDNNLTIKSLFDIALENK